MAIIAEKVTTEGIINRDIAMKNNEKISFPATRGSPQKLEEFVQRIGGGGDFTLEELALFKQGAQFMKELQSSSEKRNLTQPTILPIQNAINRHCKK
jgi:hypothetical protein